ncbi:putative copper metallochaperone [Clavispora lusitaniae]|nr:putative copper metallochaperone [Clavispora lusitaniae]
MSCSGCSKAVEKALSRLEGVNKTDVDLKAQTVDVVTDDSLNYETVLNTISKTGKKVNDGKTIN